MQWDLGLHGVGLLALMSLAAGVVMHVIWGRSAGRRMWLAATAVSFCLGLLVSEAWFGWATQEELQPNLDGLSFDEVLLALMLSAVLVAAAKLVSRRRRHARDAGKGPQPSPPTLSPPTDRVGTPR